MQYIEASKRINWVYRNYKERRKAVYRPTI
jgi:hypothetical protein